MWTTTLSTGSDGTPDSPSIASSCRACTQLLGRDQGCPKNQVDPEKPMATLVAEGYELALSGPSGRPGRRQHLRLRRGRPTGVDRHRARADGERQGEPLVVTGCLAERYGDELARRCPRSDAVAGLRRAGRRSAALAPDRGAPSPVDLLNLPRPVRPAVGLREGRRGLRPGLRVLRHPVVPAAAALPADRPPILREVDELRRPEIVLVAQDRRLVFERGRRRRALRHRPAGGRGGGGSTWYGCCTCTRADLTTRLVDADRRIRACRTSTCPSSTSRGAAAAHAAAGRRRPVPRPDRRHPAA